jgi:hypothetical protein
MDKKRILIILIAFITYIGCVMWISDGITLRPIDKFLICFLGATIIVGGITFPSQSKTNNNEK